MLYTVFYDIPTSCNSCDSGIRMHQRASSEVRNSWQASGQRHWWKTTQLSRCCWVRKTNLGSTEQSREISREAGGSVDHQSRELFTKICVSSAARKDALNSW